jgi:three-Cys-motif partner protein
VGLNYVDLYCGRGLYQDGTPSTPVEIFEAIARDQALSPITQMLFNDRKKQFVLTLRQTLMSSSLYSSVKKPPSFTFGAVDQEMVRILRKHTPGPFTFAFIDPCGYAGLTRDLIETLLADYGCDVMFYFSYHAIRRVLSNSNSRLRSHIEALLGTERVRELVAFVQVDKSALDRFELERRVLAALRASMKEIKGQDVLTFAFRHPSGLAKRHLAFVSKNPRGFEKAKQAMAQASSARLEDDIPSFAYQPAGTGFRLLADAWQPSIQKLARHLVGRLGGQSVSVKEAFDSIPGEPYIESNVRAALQLLIQKHGGALVDSDARRVVTRGAMFPKGSKVIIPTSLRRSP